MASDNIQESFSDYKNQWDEMNLRQDATKKMLAAEIAMMVHELESGNVFVAMRIAEMNVMPTAMSSIGDNIGISGSVDNIASNVRSMITNLQNRFNIGKAMTDTTAEQFLNTINEVASTLYKEYKDAYIDKTKPSALDKESLERILQGLGTMGTTLLAGSGQPPWDPTKGTSLPVTTIKDGKDGTIQWLQKNMATWFNNTLKPSPEPGAPGSPSFAPEINQVTTSLQTMTGQVSSVSTTQTSRIQSLNNTFNQLQAVMSQIAQIENGVGSAMVRNMLPR